MTDEAKANAEAEKAAADKAALEKPAAELKNKDIKYRERYKDTVQELEATKIKAEKAEKALAEARAATAKEKQMIEKKLVDAKLEALAVAAGIQDIDLVKLIDTSKAKINEAGEIEGLKEAVDEFKAKKPAFFGEAKKTSSSTNAGTASAETKPPSAFDMKREDFFGKFGITPHK